jgi:hypothetical protein
MSLREMREALNELHTMAWGSGKHWCSGKKIFFVAFLTVLGNMHCTIRSSYLTLIDLILDPKDLSVSLDKVTNRSQQMDLGS